MAQYEPKQVDVTVVLDDTLCKGTESWAWYGLRPVNSALKPGRTLIVISLQDAPTLLKNIHRREQPYKLGIVKGIASFSGMWFLKMTTPTCASWAPSPRRCRNCLAWRRSRIHQRKAEELLKVTSARTAFERFSAVDVKPGQGNPEELFKFDLPGWGAMRSGVSIKGQPQGGPYADR